MSTTAISMRHVGKRFRLGSGVASIVGAIKSRWFDRAKANGRKPDSNEFWALNDVSIDIAAGDAVGIIGPNGAGKSTVLKLLAGILRPDRGSVRVDGRLAALIEVGAGFHGDLTGRENIFLNGVILGMSRREIRRKFDDIVSFAGLERFMDTPVKRYSSGMYARLGFSIAAHVEPEILLVDEVLSVGDAMFRIRCDDRMREMVAGGTTLVFVTHNMEQMQAICRRGIVLDKGSVSFDGDAAEAVRHYMAVMCQTHTARPSDVTMIRGESDSTVRVDSFELQQNGMDAGGDVRIDDGLDVRVSLTTQRAAKLVMELNLRAAAGENLLSVNSARSGSIFEVAAGSHDVVLHLAPLPLAAGRYFWNVRIWDADSSETLVDTPFRYPMIVERCGVSTGKLALDHHWETHSVLPAPRSPIPSHEETGVLR